MDPATGLSASHICESKNYSVNLKMALGEGWRSARGSVGIEGNALSGFYEAYPWGFESHTAALLLKKKTREGLSYLSKKLGTQIAPPDPREGLAECDQ